MKVVIHFVFYRFVFTESVLYNQFLSQADYDTVKNYADQLGVVVWCKVRLNSIIMELYIMFLFQDDKRSLVVTKDGHDDVKRYHLDLVFSVSSYLVLQVLEAALQEVASWLTSQAQQLAL